MAISFRNSFAPLLCAAGLLGVAEAAPAPCSNLEIVVDAKSWEGNTRNNSAVLRDVIITQCATRIEAGEARIAGGLNFENSHWTFSDNVRIKADGGSLRSDKAIVSFRDKLISRATITGGPAEFEQQRDDGTTARGHADSIDYETTNGTVSFNKDAYLSYGRNEVTGPQFVWNIRTQSLAGQPKRDTSVGNGRVRFVIHPDKPVTLPEKIEEIKEKKP